MAEGKEDSEAIHHHQPLPFIEVLCKSSGKIRRFAAGTDAAFAVNLINQKLLSDGGGGANRLLATHIDAVKEGEEEPVSFGPTSLLVNYGSDWKLQTVVDSNGYKGKVHIVRERVPKAYAHGVDGSHPMTEKRSSPISFVYIGKILFAFLLLFVIGAVFTLFLENLPQLILYINSST
ncbi:uncharacterized protein LOC121797927 isoform X2 [Salvia splendens]|uniref:uncharacterized protein LOC121797927 isoform X2 n=1 Tax=Salvia splendens TaxID=180675 RepID=UPI001C264A20|nr:uncharacterized protein LOC121797927 isoform X2 [Salvia splendens]